MFEPTYSHFLDWIVSLFPGNTQFSISDPDDNDRVTLKVEDAVEKYVQLTHCERFREQLIRRWEDEHGGEIRGIVKKKWLGETPTNILSIADDAKNNKGSV